MTLLISSFSAIGLFVYNRAIDLCSLILLNFEVSIESIGSTMYRVMSSVNRDHFSSLFLILILFFPCLIALTRTSSTMLNSSGEYGHSFSVLILSGKSSSLSLFCVMLSLFFCILL